MRITLKVFSIFSITIMGLGLIGLASDNNLDAMSFLMGGIWIAQSICTLVYLGNEKK